MKNYVYILLISEINFLCFVFSIFLFTLTVHCYWVLCYVLCFQRIEVVVYCGNSSEKSLICWTDSSLSLRTLGWWPGQWYVIEQQIWIWRQHWRLSEHACEVSDGKAHEEEESEEKSPGSGLVKMATDGMLNLHMGGGALLLKVLLESQAIKKNPYL
jgi:hypothetical protein